MKNIFENRAVFSGGALLTVALVILVKVPHLTLPYYWDEAWVYAPAVKKMYLHGISFSPAALSPEYSRGHPLLFHVLGAAWLRVFGDSPLSMHSFAMCLSVCLLLVTGYLCARFFSNAAGLSAMVILSVQPIFLAQSSLVLPEILFSLFLIIALFCYASSHFLFYGLCAACAILTKESGIVLPFALAGYECIVYRRSLTSKSMRKVLLQMCLALAPLIPWLLFLIWQKYVYGWYLFPDHTGRISFEPAVVWNKFENYFSYLFIYQSRNMGSAVLIGTGVWMYVKKTMLPQGIGRKVMHLSGLFVVCFLLFSAVNFFSNRYILCLIVIQSIVLGYLIHATFKKRVTAWLCVAFVAGAGVYSNLTQRSNSDHNLGYASVVKTYQESVNYMVQEKLQNKKIYTWFLMLKSLTDPDAGYVDKTQLFGAVMSGYPETAEYFVVSNVEGEEAFQQIRNSIPMKRIKRFSNAQAWVEVYRKE